MLPVGVFNSTNCPVAPYNQANCPVHSTSSAADLTNEVVTQFLGQNIKSNTFEVEYDFNRRYSAHIGYLYMNRKISTMDAAFDTGEFTFPGGSGGTIANAFLAGRGDCASTSTVAYVPPPGCTLLTSGPLAGAVQEGSVANPVPEAGNDTSRNIVTINTNALLLGVVARPIDALRITGDFEFGYNDFAFTRIDPRQVQSYKIQANYKPKPWANLSGAVEIHENRDNVTNVNNLEHDRSYSFATMLMPNQRVAIDFGYNYWDVYSQSQICFNYSITYTNPVPPPTTLPVSSSPPGVNTTPCPIEGASVGSAGLGALSTYSSKDHFAHAAVVWKVTKRVTATAGYGGSFVRGNTIFLNPLTPSGTLNFNYQRPYGSIAIAIYRGFSYKMAWNYYGFDETGVTNPFGLATIRSPDYNGSNATFSFRYAF